MKTDWQILVVEDEEVTRESLAAWLREDGYTLDTAASGRDAFEKARYPPITLSMSHLAILRWLTTRKRSQHR